MLTEMTVTEFIAKTASDLPVPGGGSVSALAGALAAGLTQMVARLTLGKPKYENVHAEMTDFASKAGALRQRLLRNVDADTAAYNAVLAAYRMPKATDAEKRMRADAIQAALKEASRVPMAVAEDAAQVISLGAAVIEKGLSSARTDGLVGVMMARSAALGALRNVEINLEDIRDADFVNRMGMAARDLEANVMDLEAAVLKATSR